MKPLTLKLELTNEEYATLRIFINEYIRYDELDSDYKQQTDIIDDETRRQWDRLDEFKMPTCKILVTITNKYLNTGHHPCKNQIWN